LRFCREKTIKRTITPRVEGVEKSFYNRFISKQPLKTMGARGNNQKSYACYEEISYLRVTDESSNVSIYKRLHAQKHLPIEQRSYIVHIPVPNTKTGIRKSLRVIDRHSAIRKAENMVGEIRDDIRQGVSVIGKPVEEVVREFLQIKRNKIRGLEEGKKDHIRKTITERTYTRISGKLNNYLTPFLGKRVDIKSVKISKFDNEWVDWRNANNKRKELGNPKAVTLYNEMILLREFWKWGIKKGYIVGDISNLPFEDYVENYEGDDSCVRDTWEHNEWNSFKGKIPYWLKEQEGKSEEQYWDSYVAYQMLFMFANSGLRMGEAVKLKRGDVKILPIKRSEIKWQVGELVSRIQVHKSNKTGAREVNCQAGKYFKRVMDKSKFKKKSDYIFCHLDGTPFSVKQFRTQFESMTEYTNEDERWNKRFVPYSLRSLYATTRLQNGTNTYDLCKNMGTGEQYLKKHYSKYMTRNNTGELIKVRPNLGIMGKVIEGYDFVLEDELLVG
jgi:integrase